MTTREQLRMHLTQALTRYENADVKAHLRAALDCCDELAPASLMECPVCGTLGLPERIRVYECPDHRRPEHRSDSESGSEG